MFVHVLNLTLAGRYVGYSAWQEEPAGSEIVQTVHMDDLRTGRRSKWDALLSRGYEPGVNQDVRSLVLKPDGAVAWIAAWAEGQDVPDATYEVDAVRGDHQRKLDEGDAIKPRSLALSDDEKHVYWIDGDTARSARLR